MSVPLTPAEPQEPQEPQEPGAESPTHRLLEEIDAEHAEAETPTAPRVPGPVRRSRSAAPVGEEAPEPETPPENYKVKAEWGNDYHSWMREKYGKYRALLSVKATEDFIDHDAVNTVMADYGVICLEIVREARLYKDEAQDAKEVYEEWWNARLSEVRAPMPKATTNTAVELKAIELFGQEQKVRWATVKDAERRSEFLGSIKDMVHNMKGVLANLGHALAFEWTTTGGLMVEEGGKTFRFSPARRTGGRPPMEAVIAARRKRKEG